MPNIFISYRREDAPASTRLVYERLTAWFGNGNVFMDVAQIALGDNWKNVLSKRVARCDSVLAVIGPRWLSVTDGDGRRRLDNADDLVRWEIREALRLGKRVIPVLVDGAPPLQTSLLPPDLAALADLQAQPMTHATFDKDVQTLIEALGGKGSMSRWVRAFNRFVHMSKASLVIGIGVAAVVISLAWANVFDLLGLDTRSAGFTMLLGDVLFEVPLHHELALVGIQPSAEETNGLVPSRRKEYAKLIDLLARAGAKTVAFDIRPEIPSEFDSDLARSILAGRERGTAVAFGFQQLTGTAPTMPHELTQAADAGLTCIGTLLDQAVYGTVALITDERVYGSLPLAAAFAPAAIERPPPWVDALQIRLPGGASRWVPFSFVQRITLADADCPARTPGVQVARLTVRLSHRERLREPSRRYALSAVLGGTVDPQVFAGKRVLVGAEHPLDMLATRMDIHGRRYGFEFHADVVNALLNGETIRPMPFAMQWLMVLLMIVAAAAYRLWRLDKPRHWDILVVVGACVLYLATAVMLYVKSGLLVDGLYHIAAFILTWWTLAVLEKRWLDAKHSLA